MKHAIIFAAIALIAIAGLGGCRKNAPPQQAASTTPVAENQHPEGGTTPAGETKHFTGSIGSSLGLQMKLVREGDKLTGSYFYKKIGTSIDVRGTVDKDGNVLLEEFDSNGKQTGVFKGTWKTDEDGLIEIVGDWTRPNGDKKTAFSLREEPIEFSGGVEIVARQINEKNKKLKYEIAVEYPQLTGSVNPNFEKFNQTVRSLVTRKVSDFKKEMSEPEEGETTTDSAESSDETTGSDLGIGYSIALAKDDLISVQFEVSSYYRGAAHPNSYSETVNFDLKNGKSLKLGDLFRPGTKYLQIISAYCIQDLKKQSKANDSMLDDDWIQRGAGPEAANYDSWTITRKGLKINFDPYEVGPYAAGPQQVLVPYAALKEIINPDGPIGQFSRT